MTTLRARPPRSSAQCGRCGGLAAENARLRAELETHQRELRGASARIVQAGDAERRRLERNLHDGAQQRLVTLAVQLRVLAGRLAPDPESDRLLAQAQAELTGSLQELRELARGLHPAVLTSWGLGPAVETLAARAPFPVSVTVEVDARLGEAVEMAIYYVVSEALANAAKHAAADSARITLSTEGGWVAVEIADDGAGGADTACGTGLSGLADRVQALGGRLRVVSPPGGGTTVRAELRA